MVQIARRKKGRPSKADLAARRAVESPEAAEQHDTRRSLRRRNVRYNIIDYDDDYIDYDDGYIDEEDERRREKKKLKLMAKLNQSEEQDESRADHAPEEEQDDGEVEGEEENEDAEEEEGEEEGMVKGRKVDSKGLHFVSVSGAQANPASGIALPDQSTLQFILDKLQKKDIYGVFAEPVDPEELPDYHDVIEHPMDFATLRKKLANGSYSTLEQFESDVFLISSNAMQYNAPETIYYKQARSIQELARKKFEKLRIDSERSQVELKSEQKTQPNSLVKKLVKKPLGCASQEPVGSDFFSGATLATIGDVQPIFQPMQHVSRERSSNFDGIIEGNTFFFDANQEKAEDVLSGKGVLSKLGKKSFVLDDNRRASYNMSIQPITRSDSVYMSFESGMKQLVTVGLHAEYSYARSLARFSASLGPIAWKIASHRIQQALPAGSKFGRGWVGEYEQLPKPIFVHNNDVRDETSLVMKLRSTAELLKRDKNCKNVEPTSEHPVNGRMLEGKHPTIGSASGPVPGGNPSFFGSVGVRPNPPVNLLNQQQNVQSKNIGKSENNGLKKVELNSVPLSNQNNSSLVAKLACNVPKANTHSEDSKPKDMVRGSMNSLPSTPFKQPDTNGIVGGDLRNGKVTNASLNRQVADPSSEIKSSQTGRASSPFVVHGQDQGLIDPVQSMRMFSERAQKQQISNHSAFYTPPMTSSTPSGQRDDSGNASSAAARAWMSVGAGGFKQEPDHSSSPKNQISADSLNNQTREFHQHFSRSRGEFPSGGISFQYDKNNFPFQAFVPQPINTGAVSQFPNRPMVSPQLASADQTRFQMQSPWRGQSPRGQQKQENLPPDLNFGFQSPGSPGKQSSGVLVDSQQPDLALQL